MTVQPVDRKPCQVLERHGFSIGGRLVVIHEDLQTSESVARSGRALGLEAVLAMKWIDARRLLRDEWSCAVLGTAIQGRSIIPMIETMRPQCRSRCVVVVSSTAEASQLNRLAAVGVQFIFADFTTADIEKILLRASVHAMECHAAGLAIVTTLAAQLGLSREECSIALLTLRGVRGQQELAIALGKSRSTIKHQVSTLCRKGKFSDLEDFPRRVLDELLTHEGRSTHLMRSSESRGLEQA